MDIAKVVEELDARLQAAADLDRAASEKAYLSSDRCTSVWVCPPRDVR